jgi:hypothetical protein
MRSGSGSDCSEGPGQLRLQCDHTRRHVADPGHQPVGFDPVAGRAGGGQLADQLRRPPRRLTLCDGGHGPIDQPSPRWADRSRHPVARARPRRPRSRLGPDRRRWSARPTGDAAPGRRGLWVWPGGCPGPLRVPAASVPAPSVPDRWCRRSSPASHRPGVAPLPTGPRTPPAPLRGCRRARRSRARAPSHRTPNLRVSSARRRAS